MPEPRDRPGALLEVEGLTIEIDLGRRTVRPVTDVSFTVGSGESLFVVGESGSGKSMTLLALMGLLPARAHVRAGRALLGGVDLLSLPPARRRAVIGADVAMVFQDPASGLNPRQRVGVQVAEMIRSHQRGLARSQVWERVIALLDQVGIPHAARRVDDHPHQFSGGMRQRVMIAMAIANSPRLLLADEPTTALDVTVQAQVLDALQRVRDATGSSIVMVTHDLGVVAEMADAVVVMYAGRVVERSPVRDLFHGTRHPYTAALLRCLPRVEGPLVPLIPIGGAPPDMSAAIAGCAFAPRCPRAESLCRDTRPHLADGEGHAVACHRPLTEAVPA